MNLWLRVPLAAYWVYYITTEMRLALSYIQQYPEFSRQLGMHTYYEWSLIGFAALGAWFILTAE